MSEELHPTVYHAKFAREEKECPSEWIIVPTQGRGYALRYVGPKGEAE